MATRREFLATQFEITLNDKPKAGLVASTLAMGNDTIEGMLASSNLFLRKLGKKAQELDNATLPEHLVQEKFDWAKAIVAAEKTVKKEYLAFEKESKKKETALLSSKIFSETEIDAMLLALLERFEQGQSEIQGRLETAQKRIAEIALWPSQAINNAFLDLLYTPVTPGNGNGQIVPVDSKVWQVKINNKTFYVAIENKNEWRLYDDAKQRIYDNTDFPGVTMTSRTKVKQVLYILEHKGKEKVDGYAFSKVKAGGSAGVAEYCNIPDFKTK